MSAKTEYLRIDGEAATLVFALIKGGHADLIYLGAKLSAAEDLTALADANVRGRHESQPDTPPVPGILPEGKGGWSGSPALEIRDERGASIPLDLGLISWLKDNSALTCRFADEAAGIHLAVHWAIEASGAVFCETTGWNESGAPVWIERLASASVPVPRRFTEFTCFSGRWAGEMRATRQPISPTGLLRRSRGGKPGFGGGNWLLLHAHGSDEVIGAHLAWSGDHDTRLECDSAGAGDGRAVLQMGSSLTKGPQLVDAGKPFGGPPVLLARGEDSSALAQTFHAHTRQQVLPNRKDWGPRRVHLNSWEALSFNLSEDRLKALASDAAALGVERFVLDDGWFGGRRSDRTSLGDWIASPDVFPGGLDPLIDHVHSLDMDFGLWVEPEMVSPDSDLCRSHPDWCLHNEDGDRPTMRGQLVLDLSKLGVRDHLFERLDALLSLHAIAYLKWDHNRDLFPASDVQTAALYLLLDRLRDAHPNVEIESCSSGGGRIDYGILARTHRVWPSDNNDPVERLRIMRAWSQFLPLEVLGNHVGPSPNPITGRRTDVHFRAKIALFGHMGVEADPGAMSEAERGVLSTHIALYKQWRGVLHSGDWFGLDHPDPGIFAQMVVYGDKALAVAAQTAFSATFDCAPIRFKGLEADAAYRVTLPEPWPAKATGYVAAPDLWREGLTLSGTALMTQGLALPLTQPETAWLIALERLA